MSARIRRHIRSNVIGYMALFVALSGTAYATHPGGANTISSTDIINGEVRNGDLAADSVGSGKIINGEVKNPDLGPNSSSSNTIADGGIQGVDVANDTLTGADVNESSLSGVDAATLDGLDSNRFVQATNDQNSAAQPANGHLHARNDHVGATCGSCFALRVPSFGNVRFSCLNSGFAPPNGEMRFWFESTSAGTLAVFTDHGANDPDFQFLALDAETAPTPAKDLATELATERVIFQIERGDGGVATAIVSGAFRFTNDGPKCDVLGKAVVVG